MTAHIPEAIDNGALPSDRATQATPQAPSGLGHPVSVTSAASLPFTPGPWRVGETGFLGTGVLPSTGELRTEGGPIVACWDACFGRDEALANARLIATAPDMFTLISDIEESLTADNSYPLLREACRTILAKARGQ